MTARERNTKIKNHIPSLKVELTRERESGDSSVRYDFSLTELSAPTPSDMLYKSHVIGAVAKVKIINI